MTAAAADPAAVPVIGVSGYVEQASWGAWTASTAFVPHAYVRAVTVAGGHAVILPPGQADAAVADRLDGIVLAGGADIDPARYGAISWPGTTSRPDRDASELRLLDAARERGIPLLAICRGMQLLAVAYGGRLHQDLPRALGHDGHRRTPGVYSWHGVRPVPGTRTAAVLGTAPRRVNSYHHQGVIDPGSLAVAAWADDGLIEAVEDPAHPFLLGVQWHPEEEDDPILFRALVSASARSVRAFRPRHLDIHRDTTAHLDHLLNP